mmetsp:Transcript_3923/g.4664  ORF Transcript_3923/g.4664 Transcript_3923/m.4664 type:complete len:103 (+) Transcript_3923:1841-2149(+)
MPTDMHAYMARGGPVSNLNCTNVSPDGNSGAFANAMAAGGPESSMMDSNGPYSPKQGMMSALELPPDLQAASSLANRLEANKVGQRGQTRVKTAPQGRGRRR